MMEAKADKQFEQVVQKLALHGQLLRAWPLQGGISAQMMALEVGFPDGRTQKMIVRQPGAWSVQLNSQAAADEFRLLQLLQAVGVPAQTPYALDQSGEIFPASYLVIEYIEGQPEFSPAFVTDAVSQMATQLAKIHQIGQAQQDLSFLPKQTERFVNAFKKRPATLDDSLDEGRIRDVLVAVWPLPQPPEPVLLHGDFWPGNLLWQDGHLVAVIDWENANVGNPLVDFAISRLDVLWVFGIDAMQAFTRQYQALTTLDFSTLPYWDLYAALRPMSELAKWASVYPALGRADITEHTMCAGHRWFTTQAFETLAVDTKL